MFYLYSAISYTSLPTLVEQIQLIRTKLKTRETERKELQQQIIVEVSKPPADQNASLLARLEAVESMLLSETEKLQQTLVAFLVPGRMLAAPARVLVSLSRCFCYAMVHSTHHLVGCYKFS
jgi:hypothetical protein